MLDVNNNLNLPVFISAHHSPGKYINVNIRMLYVGLVQASNKKIKYVPIQKTPHYLFAKSVLTGKPIQPVSDYDSYSRYLIHNPHTCSENDFIKLINEMHLMGYDWQSHPILVFRHWRRPLPFGRWDVADGFHRLAVLSALGETYFPVFSLQYKYSLWRRFLHTFRRHFKTL